MKLNSKYHGIKEFKEEDIYIFEKGLPGFEKLRKFIIFSIEENELFKVLHSIEDESLGFIVVSPFDVIKDYELDINDQKLAKLKVDSVEDILVLNTVTVSSKMQDITTNLRAPIIINIKERIGEQIILDNDKYLIKYPLFKE